MQLYCEIKGSSYQIKMITPGDLLGQPALLALVGRSAHSQTGGVSTLWPQGRSQHVAFFSGAYKLRMVFTSLSG